MAPHLKYISMHFLIFFYFESYCNSCCNLFSSLATVLINRICFNSKPHFNSGCNVALVLKYTLNHCFNFSLISIGEVTKKLIDYMQNLNALIRAYVAKLY